MTCPACGAPVRGWRHVAPGEPGGAVVALLRCVGCGTAVTAGPAPPSAHDRGAYATGVPRGARAAAPVLAAFDRQRLALLRRAGVTPPATLLDVGAGRGRFVAAARAAGFRAAGIEPSARGAAAARAQYGVEVAQASVEEARVAPGSLDAVTLWHVLEHLDDPAGALGRIAGWLRGGGVLLCGVPNLASLQRRLAGGRWFHFDVPRHRTHFTPEGLDALLRRSGLEPRRARHVLAEHNPYGMWQSLVPSPTPSFAYHLLKRNARPAGADVAATVAALPLLPVAALAEVGAGLAGRGGTIAVAAVRPGRAPGRP